MSLSNYFSASAAKRATGPDDAVVAVTATAVLGFCSTPPMAPVWQGLYTTAATGLGTITWTYAAAVPHLFDSTKKYAVVVSSQLLPAAVAGVNAASGNLVVTATGAGSIDTLTLAAGSAAVTDLFIQIFMIGN
jgi:hypothetical protein|nr:MAG: hypothetical protein [Lake Baikal virophage 7]